MVALLVLDRRSVLDRRVESVLSGSRLELL